MKKWQITLISLLTIGLGYIFIMLLTGLFAGNTGDGPVNANIYNTGITAIVLSILFLAAVIINCTIVIVKAINKSQSDK